MSWRSIHFASVPADDLVLVVPDRDALEAAQLV
jgi:hypothetical protein